MNRAERRAAWLDRYRSSGSTALSVLAAPDVGPVDLHIGEIMLHGLPRLHRHDVADAVRSELTHLITTAGLPAHLRTAGRTDRLHGGPITMARGGPATAVGRQIAGAVFGGRGR
jgi:hypothetical protein